MSSPFPLIPAFEHLHSPAQQLVVREPLAGPAREDAFERERLSAAEFLDSVCEAARQAFPPRIKIVREVASGDLENDDAMPLALILNELLTNAVKYGCDGSGESQIRVGLANGDGFELYVEDDGPGFDLQSIRDRSSGLKLVQLLARQLRGDDQTCTAAACDALAALGDDGWNILEKCVLDPNRDLAGKALEALAAARMKTASELQIQ